MLRALLRQMCSGFKLQRDNRVLIALIYCNAFAALGLCIASLGPALLELAIQTSSSLRDTGYCFAARSAGYLLGSFAGSLYDLLPGHILLGCSMLGAGLGSLLIPAITNVFALGALVFLQGAGMAACDSGSNVLLIYLYGKDVGPWMQFMHFSFAAGAAVAPLLMRAAEERSRGGGGRLAGKGSVAAAFYVIGVYCVLVAGMVWAVKSPRSRRDVQGAQNGAAAEAGERTLVDADANAAAAAGDAWGTITPVVQQEKHDESGAAPEAAPAPSIAASSAASDEPASPTRRLRSIVVLLVSFLLFQYVGNETGFGAYITAYAVIALGQSEADGQVLAGMYWLAIMLGRLAAVPISMRVPPGPYLGVSMTGCVLAMLLLLLGQSSIPVVWLGTLLFGACMACIFPTAIAYAEEVFPVTGRDATIFVIGAAAGEMLIPFIISTLFGDVPGGEEATGIKAAGSSLTVGPSIMLWVVAAVSITSLATYAVLRRRGTELHVLLSPPRTPTPAQEQQQLPGASGEQ